MSVIRDLLGITTAALAAAGGCAGPAADQTTDSEPTRTYVVASVEQQSLGDGSGSEELSFFVSVLRMPHMLNGDRLLRLMGLRSDLPPDGTCEVIDYSNRASPALSSVERIEFLDVGEVSVASGRQSLRLARQAFPTVTDFIAGVVYTSREKNAELLPLDGNLAIRARGMGNLRPFSIDVGTPPRVDQLVIDGLPLASVTRASVTSGFTLKWQPGAAGDVLWVEFGTNNGRQVASCAFDDAAGSARIPGGLTNEIGDARITLHRLHRLEIDLEGFDHAEVGFNTRVVQPMYLY